MALQDALQVKGWKIGMYVVIFFCIHVSRFHTTYNNITQMTCNVIKNGEILYHSIIIIVFVKILNTFFGYWGEVNILIN